MNKATTTHFVSSIGMADSAFQKVKANLLCFNRPIYETLIASFLEVIESGELPPGTKFPPDKKLAHEFGISHITLARALNELRRRNVLERRRALGTFVPMEKRGGVSLQERRKIAVVFDSASERTFQQPLFLQLHHGLEELDCTMMFFSSGNDADRQFSQLKEILSDFSIAGCIVWSLLSRSQAEEVLHLRPSFYPMIFLDKYYPGLNHDAVTYNNYECGLALGRNLKRRKIKECYWVLTEDIQDYSSVIDREAGLAAGLPENLKLVRLVLPTNSPTLGNCSFSHSSAIVCADNLSAILLKNLSRQDGITLPRRLYDFETVTDDHGDIPEFTSFCFSCDLGTEALKILASRLNGKEVCTINHTGKWEITKSVPLRTAGRTPR